MKSFMHYYQERQDGLADMGSGPDEAIMRMARMAASDHLDDLLQLFAMLSRKDTRIRQELDEYNNKPNRKGSGTLPAGFDDEIDKIHPQVSDSGSDDLESED